MYPFKEGSFAVRNGWYVAAFANEVGRELLSRDILNEPVVLFRKEDGTPVAIGGRCPHRHFPLGKGCLAADVVVCGYHGIAFGADGKCVEVPSQRHVPQAYRVPSYPLVEHGIWLFIWMGDPDQADPAALPDLEEIGFRMNDIEAEPMFVVNVEGRYQLLNDNLLDLSHLAYLHQGNIGTADLAGAEETLTRRPGVLKSRREVRDVVAPSMVRFMGHELDRIDRHVGMDFYLPGFHAGPAGMSYPRDHPTRAGEVILGGTVFHAITPARLKTCTYFFAATMSTREQQDQVRDYTGPVLDEDKMAAEEIERMLTMVGENPKELLLRSDRNAVEARRLLQAMMDRENAGAQVEPRPR